MKRIHFFKNHFFAGLLVVIPLGVIAWILSGAFRMIWGVHEVIPLEWRPSFILENEIFLILLNLVITGLIGVGLAMGISVLGWASKHFFGKKILQFIGDVIQRIPVIRSIYSALDQLLRTLAAGGGQQFNRVVYVEYPRKGVWVLAFVTGPAHPAHLTGRFLNLYVPTTPNPTSGFHLIVAEEDVRESHLKVEEAFKTILSLGIAQAPEVEDPPSKKKNKASPTRVS